MDSAIRLIIQDPPPLLHRYRRRGPEGMYERITELLETGDLAIRLNWPQPFAFALFAYDWQTDLYQPVPDWPFRTPDDERDCDDCSGCCHCGDRYECPEAPDCAFLMDDVEQWVD